MEWHKIFLICLRDKNAIEKILRLESSMVLTFSSMRKRLDRESCNVQLMNFLC